MRHSVLCVAGLSLPAPSFHHFTSYTSTFCSRGAEKKTNVRNENSSRERKKKKNPDSL